MASRHLDFLHFATKLPEQSSLHSEFFHPVTIKCLISLLPLDPEALLPPLLTSFLPPRLIYVHFCWLPKAKKARCGHLLTFDLEKIPFSKKTKSHLSMLLNVMTVWIREGRRGPTGWTSSSSGIVSRRKKPCSVQLDGRRQR